jgi:hypothetical protein
LNTKKTTVLEEHPALVVAQSSNIKNIQPDFPTKSKTKISMKKRKKKDLGMMMESSRHCPQSNF